MPFGGGCVNWAYLDWDCLILSVGVLWCAAFGRSMFLRLLKAPVVLKVSLKCDCHC